MANHKEPSLTELAAMLYMVAATVKEQSENYERDKTSKEDRDRCHLIGNRLFIAIERTLDQAKASLRAAIFRIETMESLARFGVEGTKENAP